MKPVFQTTFNPDGNCWDACLASLLDLDIDDVPHFMGYGTDWFLATDLWLKERGFTIIEYQLPGEDSEYPDYRWDHPLYAIANGQSPRDSELDHSVIVSAGKIVHDPHPDGTGIVGRWKTVDLLVPLDPGVMVSLDRLAGRAPSVEYNPWPS